MVISDSWRSEERGLGVGGRRSKPLEGEILAMPLPRLNRTCHRSAEQAHLVQKEGETGRPSPDVAHRPLGGRSSRSRAAFAKWMTVRLSRPEHLQSGQIPDGRFVQHLPIRRRSSSWARIRRPASCASDCASVQLRSALLRSEMSSTKRSEAPVRAVRNADVWRTWIPSRLDLDDLIDRALPWPRRARWPLRR